MMRKTYRRAWAVLVPAVGIWVVPLVVLGMARAAQGQTEIEAGVQVLTRGPVHEAFAGALMTGVTVGVVIDKMPYEPITEVAPDLRPEGANVAWIPGYWSWDDDRADFIWVSGVWRDLPPGRQWVAGYWTSSGRGSQWISGFWGDVAQTTVTYLPAPPAPLEAGPSSPMPSPNHLWAPGCWVWQRTRYDWQPGYWIAQQPDWIWTPAHYTWTPRGYVHVPGYWDYDIVHRGVMFAPVYYSQPVYARHNYRYSPSIVIDLTVMMTSLFVQPRSHHYYYGDYYDRRYEERGFYPWFSRKVRQYGDDPIFAHYRSRQLRHDSDWDTHVDEQYRYRRDHVDARPPQTLALQVNVINNRSTGARDNIILGRSLAEAAQSTTLPLRMEPVNRADRKQIESRGREVRAFQSKRAKIEAAPKAEGGSKRTGERAQPIRLRLPASPVASRSSKRVQGVRTPPPMPVAPRLQAAEQRGRQERTTRGAAEAETRHSQERQESSGRTHRTETEKQKAQREPASGRDSNRKKKSDAR